MEELIRIKPNIDKARSILKMVETTLKMIKGIDKSKFPSNVIKEYYEIIRELASVILLLDGYKTMGEGAHKRMIDYLKDNYNEFDSHEILLIDDLRIIRNKIAYDGFFVKENYIDRNLKNIHNIIERLKTIIDNKLK